MNKKLKTRPFIKKIKKQEVTEDILVDALQQCNTECPFSTFPYFTHHITSKQAIKQFSSGNCVALALFIKQQLKKKHKLKSHLIPATIPNSIRMNYPYLDICHVALAVPKDKKTIYIVDPAFYFLKPMCLQTDQEDYPRKSMMKNIFENVTDSIIYNKARLKKQRRLNKHQTIPKNTHHVDCHYEDQPNDTWTYFITEAMNPDHAISKHFLQIRKHPWITINDKDYNTSYYIKILPDNAIKIEKNKEQLYKGPIANIPPDILTRIQPDIVKYLGETAYHFQIPPSLFFFKSFPKTHRRHHPSPPHPSPPHPSPPRPSAPPPSPQKAQTDYKKTANKKAINMKSIIRD